MWLTLVLVLGATTERKIVSDSRSLAPWPLPSVVTRLVEKAEPQGGRASIGIKVQDDGSATVFHWVDDLRLAGTDLAAGARALLEPVVGRSLSDREEGHETRWLGATWQEQGREVRLRVRVRGGIVGGHGVALSLEYDRVLSAAERENLTWGSIAKVVPELGRAAVPGFVSARVSALPLTYASHDAGRYGGAALTVLTGKGQAAAVRQALVAAAERAGYAHFQDELWRRPIDGGFNTYLRLPVPEKPDRLELGVQASD